MFKVVLSVENDHFRDHRSQLFLYPRRVYFMIYCEQVADFSELLLPNIKLRFFGLQPENKFCP